MSSIISFQVAVNEQKCQRDLLVTLSDQTEALLQGLGLVDAQSHHLADMILQEIRGGPKYASWGQIVCPVPAPSAQLQREGPPERTG